jgi:hypothetical protein
MPLAASITEMADNKNQHFVPRAHFRPFTVNGKGKAIHLYNIDRMKAVLNAPVKNQCSADYFYGRDRRLEDAIQFLEGHYAARVRVLEQSNPALTAKEAIVLRRFIYLQHLRTEAAARTVADFTAAMLSVQGSDFDIPSRSDAVKISVLAAMRSYAETMKYVDDLKLRIIRNTSSVRFITSDDPVVMTNRWHQNSPLTKSLPFGMLSAGLVIFMPLTPTLQALLFDGDVYSVQHKSGFVDVTNDSDAVACNQLQALCCSQNLYFKDRDSELSVRSLVDAVADRRLPSKFVVTHAVKDESSETHMRYQVMHDPDVREYGEVLVHAKSTRPIPPMWPSFLKYRRKGKVYTNGTRAGFRREATMLLEQGGPQWRKITL